MRERGRELLDTMLDKIGGKVRIFLTQQGRESLPKN